MGLDDQVVDQQLDCIHREMRQDYQSSCEASKSRKNLQ